MAAWRASPSPAGRTNGKGDLLWRLAWRWRRAEPQRRGFAVAVGLWDLDGLMPHGHRARHLESSTTSQWARAASSVNAKRRLRHSTNCTVMCRNKIVWDTRSASSPYSCLGRARQVKYCPLFESYHVHKPNISHRYAI